MDEIKRDSLIRKIHTLELLEKPGRHEPLPVVSLEEFFDGNDDYGSIGCNLLENEHPGPDGFYAVLKAIRDRPAVQDILVEVYEVEDNQWPFSERVYILTSAAQSDVSQWLASLHPDDVNEGFEWSRPASTFPSLAPGIKVYTAWWD